MPRLSLRLLTGATALSLLALTAGPLTLPASARTAPGPTLTAGVVETAGAEFSDAAESWSAARQDAEEALSQAQSALSTDVQDDAVSPLDADGRDLTLVLRDLRVGLPYLDSTDRRAAQRVLARPVDGKDEDAYPDGVTPKKSCTTHFCVWWVTSGVDAPPLKDANSNGLPDWVELTKATLEHGWDRIVTQGHYRAPLEDSRPGGDPRLDVYLVDTPYFGYTTSEGQGPGDTFPAYLAVDNDFDPKVFGTRSTPEEYLKVTLVHEFFHAVQYAYDGLEDAWLLEGTATWVEDEVFDNINDNTRYLKQLNGSPLNRPTSALDNFWYGSWIFFRYLTERFPDRGASGLPLIMRGIWSRTPGTYSVKAVDRTLKANGSSLTTMFARFGEANRHPSNAYSEGRAQRYPTAPPIAKYTLKGSKRQIAEKVATMAHLTNYTVVLRPGTGLARGAWRLRVPLDMPDKARGSRAQLSVVRTNGTRTVSWVRLNARGNGVATAPFNSSKVARVEVTITNSGQRYRCFQGTFLACEGVSRDNGLKTYFKASIRKS